MQKWKVGITALTLTAVLGTGVATASGWSQKIEAYLDQRIKVQINGESASENTKVLLVNGTAYVPIREFGNQMGLNVHWNGNENRIEVVDPTVQPQEIYTLSGIIVDAKEEEDGGKLIQVMGSSQIGPYENVKLHVSENTIIRSQEGKLLKTADLRENMKIEVDFDTRLTRSLPPIGQAIAIRAEMERQLFTGAIEEVKEADHGLSLTVNPNGTDDPSDKLILHVGYDSKLVTPNGEEIMMDQLKKGTLIRAYYGPIMTMSLPPQSSTELIIVDTNDTETK